MLIKIVEEQVSLELPVPIYTLNLEINEVTEFVEQIKKYGISWETTTVSYGYVRSVYGFYPEAEKVEEQLYFQIIVRRFV